MNLNHKFFYTSNDVVKIFDTLFVAFLKFISSFLAMITVRKNKKALYWRYEKIGSYFHILLEYARSKNSIHFKSHEHAILSRLLGGVLSIYNFALCCTMLF